MVDISVDIDCTRNLQDNAGASLSKTSKN